MTRAGGEVEELGWVESTLFAHAGPEGLCSIKSSVILDAMNQHPVKLKAEDQTHCHTSCENEAKSILHICSLPSIKT